MPLMISQVFLLFEAPDLAAPTGNISGLQLAAYLQPDDTGYSTMRPEPVEGPGGLTEDVGR